jgi:hypothetical protein
LLLQQLSQNKPCFQIQRYLPEVPIKHELRSVISYTGDLNSSEAKIMEPSTDSSTAKMTEPSTDSNEAKIFEPSTDSNEAKKIEPSIDSSAAKMTEPSTDSSETKITQPSADSSEAKITEPITNSIQTEIIETNSDSIEAKIIERTIEQDEGHDNPVFIPDDEDNKAEIKTNDVTVDMEGSSATTSSQPLPTAEVLPSLRSDESESKDITITIDDDQPNDSEEVKRVLERKKSIAIQ